MKIYLNQLNKLFSNNKPNFSCILIYGANYGHINTITKDIAKTFLGNDYTDVNIIKIDNEKAIEEPHIISTEANTVSMLGASKKVIIVSNATDKILDIIKSYLEKVNSETLIIIKAGELKPISKLRGFFERGKNVATVPIYNDTAEATKTYIKQYLRENGFTINSDMVDWISNNLGNDRQITTNELDKLILYKNDDKNITYEDLHNIISNNLAFSRSDIIYNAFTGNISPLAILLIQNNDEINPISLLRGSTTHVTNIMKVQDMLYRKVASLDEAIKKLYPPVFFTYINMFKQQVGLWRLEDLTQVLSQLITADYQIKIHANIEKEIAKQTITRIALRANKLKRLKAR